MPIAYPPSIWGPGICTRRPCTSLTPPPPPFLHLFSSLPVPPVLQPSPYFYLLTCSVSAARLAGWFPLTSSTPQSVTEKVDPRLAYWARRRRSRGKKHERCRNFKNGKQKQSINKLINKRKKAKFSCCIIPGTHLHQTAN